MKKQITYLLFLSLVGMLIFSCSKDENNIETIQVKPSIEVRSGKQGYIEHSPEELAYIESIKTRVNDLNHFDFGSDFENIKGLPDWDLAVIPKKNSGAFSSVIVPIIKSNEIKAFFHIFDGTVLTYNYADKLLIRTPYFAYVGPINNVFEQIFDFYDSLLSDATLEDGMGYDETFDDNPELSGCYITTREEIACSCHGHVMGEFCVCAELYGGTDAYIQYTSTYIPDCENNGASEVIGSDEVGTGGTGGTGNNNNNNNNNNTDARIHAANKAASSVCPIIPQIACDMLRFIIEHASNSNYCLGISTQVANLLENPTSSNIAAATCFIMNTEIQQYPSASNTCTNPFSNEPLSDFAEMYNEMNSSLISWVGSYPGLDNIPCDLTVAGYTSDEKNKILQAFKDFLGTPPAQGVDDIDPPNNPDLDKVNALNDLISNYPDSEYLPYINWLLMHPQFIGYIQKMKQNQVSIVIAEIVYGYDDWNIEEEEDPEIENGIDILSFTVPTNSVTPGVLIANNEYRHPHDPPNIIAPDMDSGIDANLSLLAEDKAGFANFTDAQLRIYMNDLIENTSMGALQDEALEFSDRFFNGTGDGADHFSAIMSNAAINTNTMKNFIKEFGRLLNDELKASEGSIQNIIPIKLSNSNTSYWRPVFSSNYFGGLKIMINDTEYSGIHLQSFDLDEDSNEWTADIYIEVFDHFGLDNDDLKNWQNAIPNWAGYGFVSWWLLQYHRDRKPFRTQMKFLVTIKGVI